MRSILEKQVRLQRLLSESMIEGGITPPQNHSVSIGQKYDTIVKMQMFLNQEIDELLLEIGGIGKDIHKPWKKECVERRKVFFLGSASIREESIDQLCFALNIAIAAGITSDNIYLEYDKVYRKIHKRALDRE